MCRLLLVFFATLSVSLSSLSWAQNTPPPQLQPRPAEPEKAPSPPGSERQIELTVQVTDKSDAPVRGLQKGDFTVLDDKRPQNILSFKAVDEPAAAPPVEIVLVVDAVNASFQAVTYERNELKKFLLQNGGKLAQPVSLVVFADTGTQACSRVLLAMETPWPRYTTNTKLDCALLIGPKAFTVRPIVSHCRFARSPLLQRTKQNSPAGS